MRKELYVRRNILINYNAELAIIANPIRVLCFLRATDFTCALHGYLLGSENLPSSISLLEE